MQLHANARTCPNSRRLLVDRIVIGKWSVTAAAEAAGVTERTVWRWIKRFREEGEQGLVDRSSRPHCSPRFHFHRHAWRKRRPVWPARSRLLRCRSPVT